MRVRLHFSIVFAFLLLTGLSHSNQGQQSAPAPEKPQLATLPESVLNANLKAASGGELRLSDYAGKVLVVNLWATWCAPCRKQVESLVKLNEHFKTEGVEIVGLSTENAEASREAVSVFINDYAVLYKIGWTTEQVATTLMQGRDAIPQTFVISRSGRIVKRFVGFNPEVTPRLLKEGIEAALEKPNLPAQQ